MTKFTRTLLFLTLILGACSPSILSFETVTPNDSTLTPTPQINTDTTPESSNPKIILTVSTPHIDQSPNGDFPTSSTSQQDCGYQWAYSDLPELTEQFDQAIKTLNPESASHATAFGENCVASDGQVIKFLTMETDFYVILSVTNLNDYEAFGDWITQVMQVVNSYPPDMLAGPNPGFVEFRFEKSVSESIGVRVPIRQYNETANNKTGEELFRMFYTEP